MDYPLQVTLSRPIESDEVADAVARLCCQIGNLQEAAFLPAASRKVGGAFVQIACGHQVDSGQCITMAVT